MNKFTVIYGSMDYSEVEAIGTATTKLFEDLQGYNPEVVQVVTEGENVAWSVEFTVSVSGEPEFENADLYDKIG